MGKADGDVELAHVFGGELDTHPLPKSRRAKTNVDSHIPHSADHHAHQLDLPRVHLIVQAAKRAPRRTRMVILNKHIGDAFGSQGALAVGFVKEATLIGKHARLNDLDVGQPSRYNAHRNTSLLRIAPAS